MTRSASLVRVIQARPVAASQCVFQRHYVSKRACPLRSSTAPPNSSKLSRTIPTRFDHYGCREVIGWCSTSVRIPLRCSDELFRSFTTSIAHISRSIKPWWCKAATTTAHTCAPSRPSEVLTVARRRPDPRARRAPRREEQQAALDATGAQSCSNSSFPRTPGRAASPQRDFRGTTGSSFTHRFRWGADYSSKCRC